MRLKTKSIFFKTALIYVFLTIVNISLFILMVFENQLDLIAENAILKSQLTGSSFKYRIDSIIESTDDVTETTVGSIVKEAAYLDIRSLVLFSDSGEVLGTSGDTERMGGREASIAELKMIHMAITKRDFEQKLFYHRIDRANHKIDLYVPFNYAVDRVGIAAFTVTMMDMDRQMGYLYRQSLLIALLIVTIHGAFAFVVSKMLLFPLNSLLKATQSISEGKLEVNVPIVREDEIGRLASSFNEMSVALKRMRDEDKGANPLSGLPGNITIARVITQGLETDRPMAVLYCDLDNFKAYNDKYGFARGDDAILYTRDCLLEASRLTNQNNIFIGHQGGDDFVAVCDLSYWEPYARRLIEVFDGDIRRFYSKADARNGFIDSVNRQGEPQRFPLMSISVAVVTNRERSFNRYTDLIKSMAEVKKMAKDIPGSSYVLDRRSAENGGTDLQPGGENRREPGKPADREISNRQIRNKEPQEDQP